MGILKDHIPLITFLRPGIISIKEQEKKYFVEEGTVEFSNNNLINFNFNSKRFKDLNQSSIEDLLNQAEKKLKNEILLIKKNIYYLTR